MSIRVDQPSIHRANRQLLLFVALAWADRFPRIARVVESWGRPIPPWGDLSRCAIVAVQRRCNEFVFRLRNDNSYAHKWHMVFHEDGRAWGSGAGWNREGNDAQIELLEVCA